MDFESLNLFGAPFEHVETYVYYDGRRTFAMRSIEWPDLYYIVNNVDEDDETGDLVYLAAAVNEQRFHALRSGLVPFQDAFTEVSAGTLVAVYSTHETDLRIRRTRLEHVSPRDLPLRWLPSPEARLNLSTPTAPGYEETEVVRLSAAQARTVFAVELEAPDAKTTTFPVRASGELQVALTGGIEALGREFLGRSTISPRELRPVLIGLRAASFVLIMAIDTPAAMLEPAEVTAEVFLRLKRLLDTVATGDDATFLEELGTHPPRVRNRFRDILRPLASAGSGLSITSVIAYSGQVVRTSASAESIRGAVDAIDNIVPEIEIVEVERGVLMGLQLRRRRFELVDLANGVTYVGAMTQQATDEANNLVVGSSGFVRARIRAEVPLIGDGEGDDVGVKFYLERIAHFEAGRNAP